MGMYINSATGGLALTRSLYQTSVMQTNILKRLSSGIRINSASDDAAGLSLSQKITSVINGNTIAKNNAQTGIAMLNTADGALSVMTNSLERIRNLAVQAANGVYSASERQMLQKEVSQLSDDISQSYQSAKFSDKNVFGAQQGVSVGTTQTQSITEAQAVAMGYNDAHIIRTAADFETKINADKTGSFIMVNDIDLSQLGTISSPAVIGGNFSGNLNGNGYSANNLKIDTGAAAGWRAGLFYEVSGTIKNLSVNNASLNIANMNGGILAGETTGGAVIDNCHVSGNVNSNTGYIGGMIGRILGGKVTNSSADVTVKGDYCVGGISGVLDNGAIIDNCISSGSVMASTGGGGGGMIGVVFAGGLIKNSSSSSNISGSTNSGDLGGLVGNSLGTILNSSASGNVNAVHRNLGGLVGRNEATGVISGCYATGNITTDTLRAGGFVGTNEGNITNSYCSGNASGFERVGGFSGYNMATIDNCYATGNVNAPYYTGGFTGEGSSTATNFYKNNMSTDIGNAVDGNTMPLPTSSWDAGVWDISGGLPALKNVARAYGSATTLVGLQIGDDERLSSKIDINTAFGIGDVNFRVSDQTSAKDVISKADQLMTFLNTMRSQVGSSINKLSSVMQIQDNRVTNLSASKSTINDADMASESAKLIQNQIRNQAATTLMSQTKGLDANLLMQLIG